MSEVRLDQDLDPIFTRATEAYKNDLTTVASGEVRYENANDPIVIDTKREWDRGTYTRAKSTYNLLTVNQSNVETNTTGFANSGGTVSRDTTEYWQGTASLKCVTPGGAATQGFTVNLTSVEVSKSYTFSVWLKGQGNVYIGMSRYVNGVFSSRSNEQVTLTNTWTRYWVTATTSSTQNGIVCVVDTVTNQTVTFYADGFQLEEGSTPTPWTVGQSDLLSVSTTPLFSRASSGWIDGTAYGYGSPRYVSGGIIIEESTTNLCWLSEGMDNSSWAKTGYSGTGFLSNIIAAPNGTLTAEKFTEDTSTGGHTLLAPSISTSAATAYTFSIYAKAGERNIFWLVYANYSQWSGSDPEFEFNLSTMTATNRGSATNTGGIVYVGDGWYRCWITSTTIGSGSTRGTIILANVAGVGGTSYTGDGTSGMYFWGAQLEAKAYPTSYVPTPTSANVSRSADSLTVPATDIINASAGTAIIRAYVDAEIAKSTGSTNAHILLESGTGSSSANLWAIYKTAAATTYTVRTSDSTPNTTSVASTGSVISVGWHTFAIRWSSTELSFWVDGVKNNASANPYLLSTVPTTLYIGCGRTGVNQWNQPIDSVNVFNTALSDADMAIYTASSGYTIPMRSDTTLQLSFESNLNFATSGIYVSEWFNAGVSGAVLSASGSVTTPTGTSIVTEYRTANSDSQSDASSWSTTIGTGKYVQFRHTLVSTTSNSDLPYVTSTTITPNDYGKGATIEESTVNLFTTPTTPATQDVTVTANGDYAISFVGTDSSSGSVTVEHKLVETSTADFSTGTLTGVSASGDALVLDTATADPTFTRATTATKRDLSSVSSGSARYEDIIKQLTMTSQGDFDVCSKLGPVVTSPEGNATLGRITDGFDADTSWAYTNSSGSVMTATFNTASSRLELVNSTTSYQFYTYNNFSAKNTAVEAVISQANGAGFVLRYTDSSNHYMIWLYDDTISATNNAYIYKRVAGVATLLAGPINLTFTRGTQYKFRAEIVDSIIKLYQDDVLVSSASDSSITAAGSVGFTQITTTPAYIHSFAIDTLTPIFGRNSTAINPQTGASVATNVVRYQKGKNLLTKNQSDVETNTTGFSVNGGGTVTLTRDTSEYWQGTASLKVVTNGGAVSQGFYHNPTTGSNIIPGVIPAGSDVVGSIYLKSGSGTPSINVRLTIGYSDGTGSTFTNTYSITTSWARYSVSGALTAGKTTTYCQLVIYNNGTAANTYYADGMQIEVGSTATTWVPGGDNAILIEEGTANFFSSSSENFTSNWSGYLGSSGTITSSQTDPFGGTSAYRIQTSGGSNTIKYYNAPGAAASGTYVSASIWVKNNDASNSVTVEGGASTDFKSTSISSTDGWKLIKMENSLSSGTGSSQIRFISSAAGTNVDVTAMNPQIETKKYCTSYIAPGSTRSSDRLISPVSIRSDNASGAIYIEAYFSGELISSSSTKQYNLFSTLCEDNYESLIFGKDAATGVYYFELINSTGTSYRAYAYSWTPTEGIHKILCKYDGTYIKIFIDGVLVGSQSYTGTLTNINNIIIGS